jgi:cell fate (sporulation/competence/biofilm development) regulator YmcA (YheA/YmcA/DUF963 family)
LNGTKESRTKHTKKLLWTSSNRSKAAGATEANSRQALATAQRLASQLRAAEDRIAELEAEVHHYREKSERAEDWLRKISAEIENRLLNESVEKRREVLRRP